MPSSVISGRSGKVFVDDVQVARITEWSANPTLATSSEWGDSDSNGYTNRTAGRRDLTADTEGKYDTSNEVWDLFQPGDMVDELRLTGGVEFTVPDALCTDFSITVDVDSAEVIGWEASWGSNGRFYGPGEEPE